MTVHKLISNRKTACGLKIPPIIQVRWAATTWDDGDERAGGFCTDGCYPAPAEVSPPAPSPVAPRPPALPRFTVMGVTKRGTAPEKVGNAVANRDQSLSVYLDALPIDGKVTLVPLVPA